MTQPSVVAGNTELQSTVLEDLSSAGNYRRWICDLAQPWLGDDAIEIGSGLGHYAAEWADAGIRITASEADVDRLEQLRARFADDSRVAVRELLAPVSETAAYSAAVAVNVLEHIPDHVGALRSFAGLVRPGGHVVVFVPAFPLAFSRFDAEIGHVRRYTRSALDSAMTSAGLNVVDMRYVNSLGLLAWVVMMRLLGGRPKDGLLLRVFDRVVVPLVRLVEARWRPPFGQSLIGVGQLP